MTPENKPERQHDRSGSEEFIPSNVSPSDSWDDPINFPRGVRRVGRILRGIINIPGAVRRYVANFEDPPRGSSID